MSLIKKCAQLFVQSGNEIVPLKGGKDGSLDVKNTGSVNAYGDAYTAQFIPQVAGECVYNFLPSNFRAFTETGGSAGAVNQLFEVSTGTSVGGYGAIQSFRTSNYKVGQGIMCRFGAIFPSTPTALSLLGAGFLNIGDEVSFGYNGTDFGTWHKYGGLAEVQHLQITAAASGVETATVTVAGTAYSVDLTDASGDVNFTAYEIVKELEADATFTAWEVEQLNDEVIFVAKSDGDKTGTFSFSSSTAAGTFSEVTAGVTKTSDFTAQDDWNGEDISGWDVPFDPSKGNDYMICFKDGFGNLDYYIEHPDKTTFVKVHTVRWTNRQTAANLGNPSLRAGLYAASAGSTVDLKVQVSDIAIITQGSQEPTRNPRAVDNSKSIGTTLTNVLTLRNTREYNGYANQVEIQPRELTLVNDGTKPAIFEIRANPTVAGQTDFQAVGANLVSELDVTGGAVSTNGRLLAAYTVARQNSLVIHLVDLKIAIPPTLRLVIAGKVISGSSADLAASLVYYEDV